MPNRPPKKQDTRSKGFSDEGVELDAMSRDVLRALVRNTIEQHLPDGYMDNIRFVEAEEMQLFTRIIRGLASLATKVPRSFNLNDDGDSSSRNTTEKTNPKSRRFATARVGKGCTA